MFPLCSNGFRLLHKGEHHAYRPRNLDPQHRRHPHTRRRLAEARERYTAQITILNRSGTGEIYFTVDGSSPTVGGNDCFVSLGSRAVNAVSAVTAPTVKLISTGALNYSVTGETS